MRRAGSAAAVERVFCNRRKLQFWLTYRLSDSPFVSLVHTIHCRTHPGPSNEAWTVL